MRKTRNEKRILGLVWAGLLVFGVAGAGNAQVPTPPDRFVDVPTDHWAYQAVENLRKEGIIVGYPDSQRRGKRTVTRYEAAIGLDRFVKAAGKRIPQRGTSGPPGVPGPRGVQGPVGPAGARPADADLLKTLMEQLREETSDLRARIAASNDEIDGVRREVKK